MGGLAHYFEAQGVPSTQISLIREHTEFIQPPRALWVPFELGRPLGAPNDADFQKEVLLAALKLLEEPSGPLLKDFRDDAPISEVGDVVWARPFHPARREADPQSTDALRDEFKAEMAGLRTRYDLAVKKKGRTTVGVSGVGLDQIADFVGAFLDGLPENPRQDLLLAYVLNFAVDDLKAYYYEAAAAQQPGTTPTGSELDSWFWEQTAAGKVLFAIKDRCLESDDKMMQLVGKLLLIPVAFNKGPR